MDLSKFEALEARVSVVLDKVASLTRQNEKLEEDLTASQDQLAAAQKELAAAEGLLSEMQADREAVLAKVDALIKRLE
ncbi:MAG: cell division protein ZapB [Candidatus Adiutrix sp.]|jgi:chromosome segregation ATPase|nr:cell division protein ZapB [Candidatus Adiutrix sp.]